jgi:hypothetical protein
MRRRDRGRRSWSPRVGAGWPQTGRPLHRQAQPLQDRSLLDVQVQIGRRALAVQTAERTGDPLLAGAAAYRMANVLLSAGHLGSARILAISAADRLRPVMTATFSHTAMWGALLATAAQAAARDHAAAEAWELLGGSKVAVDLLPSEQADLFSIFGPASWLIHAVNIAADLGDGAEAVRRAGQVPAGRLPPF